MLLVLGLSATIFISCSKDGDNDNDGLNGAEASKIVATNVKNSTSDITAAGILGWVVDTDESQEIAHAPYKNDGFVLQLPVPLDAKFLELLSNAEFEGQGTPEISNKNVKIGFFDNISAFNGEEEIGYFYLESPIDDDFGHHVSWVYADGNVTIKYEDKEVDEEDKVEYLSIIDLTLKKGWNIVYQSWVESESGDKTIYRTLITSKKPTGVSFSWTYYNYNDNYGRLPKAEMKTKKIGTPFIRSQNRISIK